MRQNGANVDWSKDRAGAVKKFRFAVQRKKPRYHAGFVSGTARWKFLEADGFDA